VGDHQCGARGSNDPSVVLVDRFGCRSRQAARGPLRPRAKSLRITSMGLATRCESIRVAKKRRKLGPGGKARRPVAGSQPNEHSVKAGSQGSTLSMEGALGQGSRSSLTGWRWKRFWFLARGSGLPEYSRGATGSVRGVHCQPCSRSKTPWQWERRPERRSVLLRNERGL